MECMCAVMRIQRKIPSASKSLYIYVLDVCMCVCVCYCCCHHFFLQNHLFGCTFILLVVFHLFMVSLCVCFSLSCSNVLTSELKVLTFSRYVFSFYTKVVLLLHFRLAFCFFLALFEQNVYWMRTLSSSNLCVHLNV